MNAFRSNGTASGMDFLPPEHQSRKAAKATTTRPTDIIDADFEIVPLRGRRGVNPVFNDNCRSPVAAVQASGGHSWIGSIFFWLLDRLERLLQTASPKAFAVLVTCLCAPIFLLVAGLSPNQPAIASTPALSINDVTTSLNDANGMKILSVYGAVKNHSGEPKAVPAIMVDVIASGHRRPATRIDPGPAFLAPGESRSFSTRLLHTGGKLPDVAVSFGQPGDSAP